MGEYLEEVLPPLQEPTLAAVWRAHQKAQPSTSHPNYSQLLKKQYARLKTSYKTMAEQNKEVSHKLEEEKEYWAQLGRDIVSTSKQLLTAATTRSASESFIKECTEQIKKYDEVIAKSKTESKYLEEVEKCEDEGGRSQTSEVFEDSKKPVTVKPIEEEARQSDLNYKKLKTFLLVSCDDIKVCAVLQALGWEVARNKRRSSRVAVVQEYIQSDLLACRADGQVMQRLLEHANKK